MEFPSDVTEPIDQRGFDVHMDVFEFQLERELAPLQFHLNLAQCRHDLVMLLSCYQPNVLQHLGMGDRALDIMSVESVIEPDTFGKPDDTFVGGCVKDTTPGGTLFHRFNLLIRRPLGEAVGMKGKKKRATANCRLSDARAAWYSQEILIRSQ